MQKRVNILFTSIQFSFSAYTPNNKIAHSGRINGEFRYLSVTCPKCFYLHQNIRFQFVTSNFRITNNLTKRLTNPQSSGYYATQHFQSPFLREKASREIGSGSRHGPYYDQWYNVAVQLQTLRPFFTLGCQSEQGSRQKSRSPAHQ